MCGVARVIFHHVWAFLTAFVGPCTAPLVATLLSQAPTPCLMNVTLAAPDLFHRVPKSKQQRLTERLLIHTVLSSSVTLLFKVLLALYGTAVPSPCSPKSDTLLYVAGADDVRSASSQITGIHSHKLPASILTTYRHPFSQITGIHSHNLPASILTTYRHPFSQLTGIHSHIPFTDYLRIRSAIFG